MRSLQLRIFLGESPISFGDRATKCFSCSVVLTFFLLRSNSGLFPAKPQFRLVLIAKFLHPSLRGGQTLGDSAQLGVSFD